MHTADAISIRFPRVTRIRHDKDWSTATTLDELRVLFKRKPESVDFGRLLDTLTDVKTSPRKKPSDSAKNTSPKKIESSRTSFWDEPSTSSRAKKELPEDIKEEVKGVSLQEGTLKRRKDCDEGSSDKVRSERKRLKREIKGKTENPSSTKLKKEGKSITRTEGSFESSFDASSVDSDVEDTVSDTVSFFDRNYFSTSATFSKFLSFFSDNIANFNKRLSHSVLLHGLYKSFRTFFLQVRNVVYCCESTYSSVITFCDYFFSKVKNEAGRTHFTRKL